MVPPDTERKWIAQEVRETPLAPRRFLLLVAALVVILMIFWKAC
jgi:hypothetical protein